MRVLRRITGIVLIVLGVPLMLAGGAGVLAAGHADDHGAFTADLTPVHTTGYAVVVPDVNDLLARHPVADLLGPARLRVTVSPSDPSLVLLVVRAAVARRYLDGVARTEVTSVGFTEGAQPVRLADLPGGPVAGDLPGSVTLAAGTDVVWDPATPDGPVSLLVMRSDGQPDLTATLTVGVRPGWLAPVSRGVLLAGALVLLAGCAVLLWRVPRELTLVVEAERLVDLARARPEPERPYERAPWALLDLAPRALRDRTIRDLTGELVPIPRAGTDQRSEDEELEDEMGYDPREYERQSYGAPGPDDGKDAPAYGMFEIATPGHPEDMIANADDQRAGRLRAAAARARRWGDRLRNRGRTAAPGRHSVAARETDDDAAGVEDDRGESPYIYTAT